MVALIDGMLQLDLHNKFPSSLFSSWFTWSLEHWLSVAQTSSYIRFQFKNYLLKYLLMQSDGFNLIFIILKLHTKFQINSPDHNEKSLENEVQTEWLTDRRKDNDKDFSCFTGKKLIKVTFRAIVFFCE